MQPLQLDSRMCINPAIDFEERTRQNVHNCTIMQKMELIYSDKCKALSIDNKAHWMRLQHLLALFKAGIKALLNNDAQSLQRSLQLIQAA